MTEAVLPCVEIDPPGEAKRSVIWLHGLGADGHDFEPIVPFLQIPDTLGVRFVFPHAPSIPVTINGGFVMPAWYDIKALDLRNRADEEGVRDSAKLLTALIARENTRGVPTENIVLAGFSQGGAVAMHTALRHPERLAGIVALSTYLVCADTVAAERNEANLSLPIFQAHGTADPMVPLERGRESKEVLETLGYEIEWHTYPIPHSVSPEEIADIGAWLRARWGAAA